MDGIHQQRLAGLQPSKWGIMPFASIFLNRIFVMTANLDETTNGISSIVSKTPIFRRIWHRALGLNLSSDSSAMSDDRLVEIYERIGQWYHQCRSGSRSGRQGHPTMQCNADKATSHHTALSAGQKILLQKTRPPHRTAMI